SFVELGGGAVTLADTAVTDAQVSFLAGGAFTLTDTVWTRGQITVAPGVAIAATGLIFTDHRNYQPLFGELNGPGVRTLSLTDVSTQDIASLVIGNFHTTVRNLSSSGSGGLGQVSALDLDGWTVTPGLLSTAWGGVAVLG